MVEKVVGRGGGGRRVVTRTRRVMKGLGGTFLAGAGGEVVGVGGARMAVVSVGGIQSVVVGCRV